ncbi:tetratricopeptide repeat protein [Rhodanobacter umsongensis]|uniref:Tetratricopeptide repeat protein n=2 Tax=Rhodanobacter umsongensis TaxID=633153 RepID=A0ABW0JQ12_9GAMM
MLRQAVELHRTGQLDAAEAFYRRALQTQAGQPDALHFLGVLCHQRGRSDEGIRLIRMALRATPLHADAHNNLGNIHKETGELAEAEACYRQALACHGQHHDALSNLALVLETQERFEEALQAYVKLLEEAPQLSLAHYLMGMYLRRHVNEIGDLEQAVACFRDAIRCDASNVRALDALGVTLYMLGRQDEAVGAYRDWLVREPENPVPRHMLAACGGEVAPPRADDAYVREVFDRFAESFDEQLLKNLDYRAPQVLVGALIGVLGVAEGALDVLDAGCGTGLCGPLIRPHARRLDGVDLSGGMLDKARLRGGYDELAVAELTAYLQDHPEAWDVVLSADTLVYFGDLAEVLAATSAALRAGGRVAFTLEAMEGDQDRPVLASSGRYRHARGYVERVLDAAGFVEVSIAPSALRKEVGQPVNGWVVLARKRGHGFG